MSLLKEKLAGQVGAHCRHHSLSSSSRDNSRISMSPAVVSSSPKPGDLAMPWSPGCLRHLDTEVEVRPECKVSGADMGIQSYCSCPMVASSSRLEVRTAFFGPAKPQFSAGLYPQAHMRIHLQITGRKHLRDAMLLSQRACTM
jgi:hypothetical protein